MEEKVRYRSELISTIPNTLHMIGIARSFVNTDRTIALHPPSFPCNVEASLRLPNTCPSTHGL